MNYIIGHPAELVWVAGKAFLLYFTAVVGFRIGERRSSGTRCRWRRAASAMPCPS